MFCFSTDVSSDHGEHDLPTGGTFEGHQEAVNAMQVHNGLLYTCSGDRTVRAFDLVVSGTAELFRSVKTGRVNLSPPTCCRLTNVWACLRVTAPK